MTEINGHFRIKGVNIQYNCSPFFLHLLWRAILFGRPFSMLLIENVILGIGYSFLCYITSITLLNSISYNVDILHKNDVNNFGIDLTQTNISNKKITLLPLYLNVMKKLPGELI